MRIPKRIEELIIKYLQDTATKEQISELNAWYQNADLSEVEIKELTKQDVEESGIRMRQNLQQKITPAKARHFLGSHWWKVAAVLILLLAGLWWMRYSLDRDAAKEKENMAIITNLQPGHTGAVLHLDDGRAILLDSTTSGRIASESGVEILKDASGIQYKGAASQQAYNTISTQRGRIWFLALPDGTKVWLNAASSIRFPLRFKGPERLVELTGEAYFEVRHNAKMPFKVKVDNQIVEDLGTRFNINAYGDHQNVLTTLVEGSLRIHSKELNCVLVPGQQARVGKDNIICEVSRMETVTSWKDGYFDFYDAGLKDMLQQISRWYNFEVSYEPGLTRERFTGRFPKNLPLGKALEILKQAGINFSLEPGKQTDARSIIVSPM